MGTRVVERRAPLPTRRRSSLLGLGLCLAALCWRLGQRLGDLDWPRGLLRVPDCRSNVLAPSSALGRVLLPCKLAALLPARQTVVLAVLLLLLLLVLVGLGCCARVRGLAGV
jgi:hypothetical protein